MLFSVPLAQQKFMLDPCAHHVGVAIGALGAGIVEVLWWLQGAVTGNRRRVWR